MQVYTIIPLQWRDLKAAYWRPLVEKLVRMNLRPLLALNGKSAFEPDAETIPYGASYMDCGEEANPYTARNKALHLLFCGGATHVVLMDADVLPRPDYADVLEKMLVEDHNGDLLIAGRTLTAIPEKNTFHFNRLREANFECYDGFTPPDHTIGANMIIGRTVYQRNGPMRENKVSGGDSCYGIDWKEKGGTVTVGTDLIVTKTIYGMNLQGIIEKQLRRALCYPPQMMSDPDKCVGDLGDDCLKLAAFCGMSMEELGESYPEFTDRIFKLMMRLGMLCQYVDKELPRG